MADLAHPKYGDRISFANQRPIMPEGEFVLYWMIAERRLHYNFALERAIGYAQSLKKPLIILEALRTDYPWASDRFHSFILKTMADHRLTLKDSPILYFPFVETPMHPGSGLLKALSKNACAIVTDEFPCFFFPKMVEVASQRVDVRLERVDSNGILPLRSASNAYTTARAFRRHLQKHILELLSIFPLKNPLLKNQTISSKNTLPKAPRRIIKDILTKWPMASEDLLSGKKEALSHLSIDHRVTILSQVGGESAAREKWNHFKGHLLNEYEQNRRAVWPNKTSGLSPYLHFGNISTFEIIENIFEDYEWDAERINPRLIGKNRGFWGLPPAIEAFLDEVITWRELGFNGAFHLKDYGRYTSLPGWAKQTLKEHENDARPYRYSAQELEQSNTHDLLWNAAQNQLVNDGYIHNYLRMLWGKKILQWTGSPREALQIMIHLNNKYALDGRDPNSYSGIFWVLGRYDRAWGPERAVFGKIRYMSSRSTQKKYKVSDYMNHYRKGPPRNKQAK